MNLDQLLHATKTFAELLDGDIETFLRDRSFGREHLHLEFKVAFKTKANGKYDIREFCRYVAGFSNEEGGIIVFGVADSIKDAGVSFPDYVPGLQTHPSIEDVSSWVTDRVTPLVQSPAMRTFTVAGKTVMVLKIPEGLKRPYAYVEPNSGGLTFFKKTAGGIKELRADEVKDLYWSAIIDQATRILRAGALKGFPVNVQAEDPLIAHRDRTLPLIEDPDQYGHLGIYCSSIEPVSISVESLKTFLSQHSFEFAEAMRYAPRIEVFQSGVTVGYYPRAIRHDIKSTSRVTLYSDGKVAYDSQLDTTMERDHRVNPYWLAYELQRQLQLAKAVLAPQGVSSIHVVVELDHVDDFRLIVEGRSSFDRVDGEYTGASSPIVRDVKLADIHDHDGDKRNVVSPAVKGILDEVSRIFGLPRTPHGVWDSEGYLGYVKGLENQR